MLGNPDWSAVFAPDGAFLREGEVIKRTNYSRTLAAIASEGPDAFYKVHFSRLLSHFLSHFFVLHGCLGPDCGFFDQKSSRNRGHPFPRGSRELQSKGGSCFARNVPGAQGVYQPCAGIGAWCVQLKAGRFCGSLFFSSASAHAQPD